MAQFGVYKMVLVLSGQVTRGVLVAALLGTGCDRVFNIDQVFVRDSQAAPPDATPPACPQIGMTPEFKGALYNVPAPMCRNYSISQDANLAMAVCASSTISEGPIDASLEASSVDDSPIAVAVRVAPEGDIAVLLVDPGTLPRYFELRPYRRGTDKSWSATGAVATKSPLVFPFSAPSRGPDRRMFVVDRDTVTSDYVLREFAENPSGVWSVRDTYDGPALGFPLGFESPYFTAVNLTSDGLRMIFRESETNAVLFSDRASKDQRFSTPRELATVPPDADDPYLSEDCGRLYFHAFGTVFSVAQS